MLKVTLVFSALLVLCLPTLAQDSGDDLTAEQKQQLAVGITRMLEQDPLGEDAKGATVWLTAWLINTPDVTVTMCLDQLGATKNEMKQLRKHFPALLLVQPVFSTAAYMIETGETDSLSDPALLAGVKGALSSYRAIVRERPKRRSAAFERLLERETEGTLADYIAEAGDECRAKRAAS